MADNTGLFVINGPIGANMKRRTNPVTEVQPQEFALGTAALISNGFIAIYVHAPSAIGESNAVSVSWSGTVTATSIQTASATYTNFSVAFAAGDYGWVFKTTRVA